MCLWLLMGACFSSELDEQHSSHHKSDENENEYENENENENEKENEYENENEVEPSSTEEDALTMPEKQGVLDLWYNPAYSNLDSFTYDEMRRATKLFRQDEVLGEGGFGRVYKGVIDECVRSDYPRTEVAVKVLNHEGMQGDAEWLAEVNYLGHVRHPNIVKLIGYCCEEAHRLLVYEYMANGSVEHHLFREGRTELNWSRRMKIALDAAKGLSYLHNTKRPVIFRDFKTSNILLDENFNAKLSDFGLAKDGPTGPNTHVSTAVKGTYGYAAPEYFHNGHLSSRCDTYAFGIVLLEMLTGQRAVDTSRPSKKHYLVNYARKSLVQGKKATLSIFDPRMEGEYSSRIAISIAELAYVCLRVEHTLRPLMSEVVIKLESILARRTRAKRVK